jgi:predicted nucleic acid-binding Zn ribbon protein
MPIYEYRRPDGTTFEIQQSFSEDALTVDPDTGVPVERVLHPPAVHFKGKGFYNTDYGTRKRQRETAAAAEGPSSEKDTSSSSKDSSSKDGSSSSTDSGGSGSSSSSGDGAKGEKAAKGSGGKSKDAKPAASSKT